MDRPNRSNDGRAEAMAIDWRDASTANGTGAGTGAGIGTGAGAALSVQTQRVLRNTYALLAVTLLFSGGVAALGVANAWPSPGLLISLAGSFGLLFAVHALRNSGWSIVAMFAFTGFMGYTLGPVLARTLSLPGGGQVVALALGTTGLATLGMSAWALTSKRDFSRLGGMLFAGLVVAIVLGLAAVFLKIPALALAVSAMVALISCAMILVETSRIVNGGETNYVMAAVGLYVSIYNLFSSLLMLLGIGGGDD